MLTRSMAAAAALTLAASGSLALACNTPVYRYAMYNWQTAPYIVFCFHEGEVAGEDKAVHEALNKLTAEFPAQANVRLEPIDVSDAKKMETLPEFVIDAWKSHEDGKTPVYVIFSPFRAHIYSGGFTADSVKKLIDSPARQRFAQLLDEGNAAVMILLTCADEAQNKKAEEALAGLRKMADAGEIPVELELPPMGLPGQSEEGAAAARNKLGIAVLKVDRKDPAEEFFVRMLMAVEEDLDEYADQPMIFAGYGRGRAMEPYIGKGITAENLVDVVAFLAGACSCMVKEQNPGADLLVKWDWEKTADKMAENDPSLDYGPYGPQGYGEFAAEPSMSEEDNVSEASAGASTEKAAEPAAAETSQVAMAASPANAGSDVSQAAAVEGSPALEDASAEPPGASNQPVPAVAETVLAEGMNQPAADGSPAATGSFSGRRMATYAFGFGAIAVGVLLAGLALALRRS